MAVLKTWMTDNQETDESLAAKLGLSRVQVSRLRRLVYRPSPQTALKLQEVTTIPAGEFLLDDVKAA